MRETRFHQILLIGSFLPLCWLTMMAVHELGHVLAAWLTGGVVAKVVLHPLVISRTELAQNPQPLFVAWAGPITGVAVPLLFWLAMETAKLPGAYLARFWAGFCLVANGLYLGAGSFKGIGDCGDLLRHGAPIWTLWLFGAAATIAGFALWHNQERFFGRGAAHGRVSPAAAYTSLGLLTIVFAVELWLDWK